MVPNKRGTDKAHLWHNVDVSVPQVRLLHALKWVSEGQVIWHVLDAVAKVPKDVPTSISLLLLDAETPEAQVSNAELANRECNLRQTCFQQW